LRPLRALIGCGMNTSLQSPCPKRPKSPLTDVPPFSLHSPMMAHFMTRDAHD
jgi:hypothetical protein